MARNFPILHLKNVLKFKPNISILRQDLDFDGIFMTHKPRNFSWTINPGIFWVYEFQKCRKNRNFLKYIVYIFILFKIITYADILKEFFNVNSFLNFRTSFKRNMGRFLAIFFGNFPDFFGLTFFGIFTKFPQKKRRRRNSKYSSNDFKERLEK